MSHKTIPLEMVDRRQFLGLAGASVAAVALSGCSVQPPREKILPYVRPPEVMVPGRPLFFATALTLGGYATGVLAESHEGRPTKIEGNPDHPASLGATDSFCQAAILDLYDPERSQTVTFQGGIRSWEDAVTAIRGLAEKLRATQGKGLHILTETVTSPTLAFQLGLLLQQYPQARWHEYEPVNRDMVQQGAQFAFGRPVQTQYRFDKAAVVLSLDADFLCSGLGHVRYVHDYMARRRPVEGGKPNRLYAVESTATTTGAKADHCWPMRPSQVETFARIIAGKLQPQLRQTLGTPTLPIPEAWLDALVRDLQAHRGASIILAGDQQSPAVHVLAHALNQMLGNVGQTVIYTEPVVAQPVMQTESLRQLVRDMERGEVQALVILDGNPVYNAPVDLEFAKHLAKVPTRIHLGLYVDETAAMCHWHIPAAHPLEAWSDARAYDGTVSIVQPLIAPLYGGKSSHELFTLFTEAAERPGYIIVKEHWRGRWEQQGSPGDFETFWNTSLHNGFIANTALLPVNVALAADWATKLPPQKSPTALEIQFRADPTIYDGRFANNAWLQELPKPLTKLTWDNALILSPKLAAQHGLSQGIGFHGGERGDLQAEMVEVTYQGRKLRLPAWVVPGQPDDAVTLHLGYGRTRAGKHGTGTGFNAYRLRSTAAPWFDGGVEIRKVEGTYPLACTQFHQKMEGRDLVRSLTFAQYATQGQEANGHGKEHKPSFYNGEDFPARGLPVGHGHRPHALLRLQCVCPGLSGGKQHSQHRQSGSDARPGNALAAHRHLSR
jgi:molybdopterin-containing oxidoreductase family iron-sulfur binding subunit